MNYEPKKFSSTTSIPWKDLHSSLRKNRFFREKYFIITSGIRIPKGTTIAFEIDTSERTPGFFVHRIVLKKENFFNIRIDIEFLNDAPQRVPPALQLAPFQQKDLGSLRTYLYLIRMRSEFDRLTSGNQKTEEYKEWTKWIFDSLKYTYGFIDVEKKK